MYINNAYVMLKNLEEKITKTKNITSKQELQHYKANEHFS